MPQCFYHAPICTTLRTLLWEEKIRKIILNVCNAKENGVCTRRAAIVNHSAIANWLRVVHLLSVVLLVRRGASPVSKKAPIVSKKLPRTTVSKEAQLLAGSFQLSSIAPNAGRHKAGRMDFPHFGIPATLGKNAENAENVDLLLTRTKI